MRNLPAGRMARLWLRARLEVAGRAVKVLEQKIQALNREQRRARHHAEETERVWNDALRQADLWFLRATVIGGSLQIGLAQSQVEGPAEAHIRWRSLMGVTYPAEVSLETPGTGAVGSGMALLRSDVVDVVVEDGIPGHIDGETLCVAGREFTFEILPNALHVWK